MPDTAPVRQIVMVRRKAGLSREEFRRGYEESHSRIAVRLFGHLWLSYRRNYLTTGHNFASGGENAVGEDTGFDAISEFVLRDAAAQAAADADDNASGGWGAQHLRHASVRLGEPGEQAIDIQLSMAGQEVRVEFRTDDAQTRASLAQDGGAALGELLGLGNYLVHKVII